MKYALPYLFIVLGLLPCEAVAAQGESDVSFELIVDSQTSLPDTPELRFAGLGGQSVVNTDSSVAFKNTNILFPTVPSANGIFEFSNSKVRTIAQSGLNEFGSHSPPQGFLFEQLHGDGANVVFRANGPTTSISTIYRESLGGDLARILGTDDSLPNNAGSVNHVYHPRVFGANILLTAVGDDGRGRVYRTDLSGAKLSTFLDVDAPGFERSDFIALGDAEDGHVAFRTRELPTGTHTGVYTSDLDGAVTPIARLGDPLPGAPGQTIGSFAGDTLHPSISDGRVVFHANGSGNTDGIYAVPVTGGAAEVIVDDTMELPNDNGFTAGFGLASISGDNVSFLGITAAGTSTGLWVSVAGDFVNIVSVGDEFDGREVLRVFSSPFSMSGNTVAFEVVFTDQHRGLYLATVIPAPGTAATLALAGLWGVRRRR